MSRHKAYALSPRDCLKTTLFQKWQRMVAPPGWFDMKSFEILKLKFISFKRGKQKLNDLQTSDASVKVHKRVEVLESIKPSRLYPTKNDHPVQISH